MQTSTPRNSIPAKFKAAAVQMNSTPDLATNLKQAAELIERAAGAGAELIGLPEFYAFMGPEADLRRQAAEIAQAGAELLADQAKKHNVTLLGGTIRLPPAVANDDAQLTDGDRIYNCARVFAPDGSEVARYDKIHLFDVDIPDGVRYRESDYIAAGEAKPTAYASAAHGVIGLTICYDLRFPELYRALTDELHSDIIFAPAAFTAFTGAAHWELLIRTRAVENTCYIVAPAQTGVHYGKRESYGHALIVDPWGDVIADAGSAVGFAIAEIDPARLSEVRTRLPALRHRRL